MSRCNMISVCIWLKTCALWWACYWLSKLYVSFVNRDFCDSPLKMWYFYWQNNNFFFWNVLFLLCNDIFWAKQVFITKSLIKTFIFKPQTPPHSKRPTQKVLNNFYTICTNSKTKWATLVNAVKTLCSRLLISQSHKHAHSQTELPDRSQLLRCEFLWR